MSFISLPVEDFTINNRVGCQNVATFFLAIKQKSEQGKMGTGAHLSLFAFSSVGKSLKKAITAQAAPVLAWRERLWGRQQQPGAQLLR